MVVNGLTLPTAYERLIGQGDRSHHWTLKENQDAYGHYLGLSDLELFTDMDRITRETEWLPGSFKIDRLSPGEVEQRNVEDAGEPGFIPFITDFSRIVQFGRNGEGDPCCFDFRENSQEPSVIFFDEYYWRRIAPDFKAFIGLYRPVSLREMVDKLKAMGQDLNAMLNEEQRRRLQEALDREQAEKDLPPEQYLQDLDGS